MDSKNKERNSTFKALKNRNRRDSLGSRLTGQRSELKITNPTNSPRRVICSSHGPQVGDAIRLKVIHILDGTIKMEKHRDLIHPNRSSFSGRLLTFKPNRFRTFKKRKPTSLLFDNGRPTDAQVVASLRPKHPSTSFVFLSFLAIKIWLLYEPRSDVKTIS